MVRTATTTNPIRVESEDAVSLTDSLITEFNECGITSAHTILQQISLLLFIRFLDYYEYQDERGGQQFEHRFLDNEQELRWSNFKNLPIEELLEIFGSKVYKHFQNFDRDDLSCCYLMKSIKLEIQSPIALSRIVSLLEQIPMNDVEKTSVFFETLLNSLMIHDLLYENFTSTSISRLMVELVESNPGDNLGDPACGTGGLICSALNYCDDFSASIHGYDSNVLMMQITTVNLMMHGINNPRIQCTDSLSLGNADVRLKEIIDGYFDIILCDPPNRYSTNREFIDRNLIEQAGIEKIELLFLARSLQMLKEQGRAAIIVPDEFLFSELSIYYLFRKQIIEEHELQAVISIPNQSNEWAYRGKSSIIVLKKGARTKNVFFYDISQDRIHNSASGGYQLSKFDHTNCIRKFKTKESTINADRTENGFYVAVDEIKKSQYVINYNRYVELVYENEEIDQPTAILEDIKSLNKTIGTELTELEEVLK